MIPTLYKGMEFDSEVDLAFIKDQFQHHSAISDDTGAYNFITHWYFKAFGNDSNNDGTRQYLLKKSKGLIQLLVFFAYRCEAYEFAIPKEHTTMGVYILDIADKFAKEGASAITQREICECLSLILLECHQHNIYINMLVGVLNREYISGMAENEEIGLNIDDMNYQKQKETMQNEMRNHALNHSEERERWESDPKNQKFYINDKGQKIHYNPFKENDEEKLQRLQNTGTYKNAQVRERAVEAFKYMRGM